MMLALGSGCKYRLSLAKRFDCIETTISQLFADSYEKTISVNGKGQLSCICWQSLKSSAQPLPQPMEKPSSTKLVPDAKKVGDCWCRASILQDEMNKFLEMIVVMVVQQYKCP